MNVTTSRKAYCRYHDRRQNPCTGEAIEEGAEIMLCTRHLALAAGMYGRLVAEAQLRHANQLDAHAEELAAAS